MSSGDIDELGGKLGVKKRVKTDESDEKAPKKDRKRIQKRKKDTTITNEQKILDPVKELTPKLEESSLILDGQKNSFGEGSRRSQISAENLSSNSKSSSILEQQALIKRSLHTYYEMITIEIEDHQIYSLTGVSMNYMFLFRLVLIEILIIS